LELVINIVLPVFAVVFSGWFACRSGGIPMSAVKALNHFIINYAVPPMLFLAMAKVSLDALVNPSFITAYFIATTITMLLGVFGYRGLKSRDSLDATVISLICGWGNTIYMGVPLAFYLFGEKGTVPVVIATLSTNMVFIAGLALVGNKSSGGTYWQNAWNTFSRMFLKNPVLIGPIAGGVFSYFSIPLPVPVNNLLSMLAPSAAPVALFAMGASLVGIKIQGETGRLVWVTLVKVVANPLIALLVVYLMKLEPFWAASVVLMSSLPTGSMVFILARQYERRVELASGAIMSTTILSLLSLAAILPLLKIWVD